jgi:hypothetical protein
MVRSPVRGGEQVGCFHRRAQHFDQQARLVLDARGAVAQKHERAGGIEHEPLGAELADEGRQIVDRFLHVDVALFAGARQRA